MNDEIKVILDNLRDYCKTAIDNKIILCNRKEMIQLLDYIANLQEENEKVHKDFSELSERYFFTKSRCEKAIEYIMSELITEWDIRNDGYVSGSDLPADAITPIIDILNGGKL